MSETHVRKSPCEMNRANPGEEDARKSPSEQIARASSNKTSEHASQSEAADRKSLSERIAQANAARVDGAWSTPDEQLVEAERRTPFQVCNVYCAHAEELLPYPARWAKTGNFSQRIARPNARL